MELWKPDQLHLNGVTTELLEDVREVAARIEPHRPLPPDVVRRIDDELLGERVYGSNSIEGNTLDLRETVMILKQGIAGAKKKREATEARNLGEAILLVGKWLSEKTSCHAVDRVLEVHKTILRDIEPEWAGRFRDIGVAIRGAKYQPPDASLVRPLTERVLEIVQTKMETDPVAKGAWTHWALARVHPFTDGNGRLARLWQDIVLLEADLTCAVIRPEDRRLYLDALGSADEGDFNSLIQFVASGVIRTFDKYLTELAREDESEQWLTELVGEADGRVAERTELAYARWSRKMETLRREFEVCAARLSERSEHIGAQVQHYPPLDRATWDNIRLGVGAQRTWYFILDFDGRGVRKRYYFFFGKHFRSDLDDARERSEERVSLLIGEDDGTGKGVRLDQIADCPISIREIFVVGNDFVCRRVDPSSATPSHDRNTSALRIAQDFIRDVVRYRLT